MLSGTTQSSGAAFLSKRKEVIIMLVLGVFLGLLIIPVIVMIFVDIGMDLLDSLDVILCFGSKKHNPKHPGITEKTIFGKRDILCPKCSCLYCKYVYVYKGEIINPFEEKRPKNDISEGVINFIKDFIINQDKQFNTEEKYKCVDCGYIFK